MTTVPPASADASASASASASPTTSATSPPQSPIPAASESIPSPGESSISTEAPAETPGHVASAAAPRSKGPLRTQQRTLPDLLRRMEDSLRALASSASGGIDLDFDAERSRVMSAWSKHTWQDITDEAFHQTLLTAVYGSGGFAGSPLEKHGEIIREKLSPFRVVADLREREIDALVTVPGMFPNRAKVAAVVKNAATIVALVRRHSSVKGWLKVFQPTSPEGLERLRNALIERFKNIGPVNADMVIRDLGLPSSRPDPFIRRVFHRLCLTLNEDDLPGTRDTIQTAVLTMSRESGLSPRAIESTVARFASDELDPASGHPLGICRATSPACDRCLLLPFCPSGGRL